ncbi:hypothetical protein HOY80DRAFT_251619 [Tuber brumale]|nr:hypothetical protein HOY80DRAFT_251619 [Tuber brumale]
MRIFLVCGTVGPLTLLWDRSNTGTQLRQFPGRLILGKRLPLLGNARLPHHTVFQVCFCPTPPAAELPTTSFFLSLLNLSNPSFVPVQAYHLPYLALPT